MQFYLLMLGGGVSWTLAYALIIWRGVLDRTYGMPMVALCANISWEFIFSFVYPQGPVQTPVNVVWFFFDVVILSQVLRYGPRESPDLSRIVFYAMFALALATAFCTVLFVTLEFGDLDGAYAAFGQNLMMSVLFIAMLRSRRSLLGQSLAIALCKMAGTALASVAFYLYAGVAEGSVLLPFLFVSILVFDLIYAVLVYGVRRTQQPTKT